MNNPQPDGSLQSKIPLVLLKFVPKFSHAYLRAKAADMTFKFLGKVLTFSSYSILQIQWIDKISIKTSEMNL